MVKKLLILLVMLIIFMVFFVPSIAEPTDVALDQQVEMGIPGLFNLVDADEDGKAESINFTFELKAYREGNFIVSGNLEGKKNGHWVALGTTVIPFQWSPRNTTVNLAFTAGEIVKHKISGPYRVSIALKDGGWELPPQIAGFSAKYSWKDFNNGGITANGEISTIPKAKQAAETWAKLQSLKIGELKEISYNYDRWRLDYQGEAGQIIRFLISPQGAVELLRINKNKS